MPSPVENISMSPLPAGRVDWSLAVSRYTALVLRWRRLTNLWVSAFTTQSDRRADADCATSLDYVNLGLESTRSAVIPALCGTLIQTVGRLPVDLPSRQHIGHFLACILASQAVYRPLRYPAPENRNPPTKLGLPAPVYMRIDPTNPVYMRRHQRGVPWRVTD